ncbi:MAG: RagB/SusD family nutrient uptake outer membrane protein [Candidatus Pseudobacter hemicellulosilyticus]|uniref:RagB/SusD family nutrient uptake outer membrane protein n=1 Tax=Candidatus Pseudobacter hemicellulosilyticus TaxID=3121375 RepID=A0AAJ6BG51_9BACT|nr:MAG: RagB/SusD family nutrient uptake outer membrane protein [Pseudobacter sp.]
MKINYSFTSLISNRNSLLLASLLMLTSCEKYVEIDAPKHLVTANEVFVSESTLLSALSGMYSRYYSFTVSSNNTFYNSLQADELQYNASTPANAFFENNAIAEDNSTISSIWNNSYSLIYTANSMLEGLENNTVLSGRSIRQARGEALFMRALIYFRLINYWNKVPLVTTTDYTVNRSLPRAGREEVYRQMVKDLDTANALLTPDYPSTGKLRPNQHTVSALLAQVQLFAGNWEEVVRLSTEVIGSPKYSIEEDLNKVFIAASKEALWQIKATGTAINTKVGQQLLGNNPKSTLTSYVREELLNAFEADDDRKNNWITPYSYLGEDFSLPYKYKLSIIAGSTPEEYEVQFRLAELYLYRAEAYARLGQLDNAIDDLNKIRGRAGLPLLEKGILNQTETVEAVWKEARIELMFENGHRWYNLKRTGKAVEVLSAIKTGFSESSLWFPVPMQQLNDNPALGN